MYDPYSTLMLIKHYAWHARDSEHKPALARRLLQAALEIAKSDSLLYEDQIRQLRRDIAELDYKLDLNEDALARLVQVGDGFRVGDILLQQGKYEGALEVYEEFHAHGRFKNYWRLWRCNFLLSRFQDVVQYLEQETVDALQRVVTDVEARALAVAAFSAYGHFTEESSWERFVSRYPHCSEILKNKIGDLPSVILVADRWSKGDDLARLRKRIIGKLDYKPAQPSEPPDIREFEQIIEKARKGISDIPNVEGVTATSILKGLASSRKRLDGRTTVEYMCKGFIHLLVLEPHKQLLAQLIDVKLAEFEKSHGQDLVALYSDTILGGFGFYEVNEVSKAIKSIVLAAEAEVRKTSGLPPRGEGWLAESQMLRLLSQKFSPHEVLSQYSPEWLQGLRFDAYIPDFKLAIEYQGEQHYKPVAVFGGEAGFSQTVKRDQLKRALAAQNTVTLEYISYEQDIDQETTRLSMQYLT